MNEQQFLKWYLEVCNQEYHGNVDRFKRRIAKYLYDIRLLLERC